MRVPNSALFSLSFSLTTLATPIANSQNKLPNSDEDYIPPHTKPSEAKPNFLTIFTDADVTWCRPWPNTAIHPQNSVNLYKGTPVILSCWTRNDKPRLDQYEAGESEPWDIWVRTEGHGCYINENDLRSANIDFENRLRVCTIAGPHLLAGNRPDTTVPMPEAPPSPLPPVAPLPAVIPAAPQPPASPLPPPAPAPPVAPAIPTPITATPAIVVVPIPQFANASQPLASSNATSSLLKRSTPHVLP